MNYSRKVFAIFAGIATAVSVAAVGVFVTLFRSSDNAVAYEKGVKFGQDATLHDIVTSTKAEAYTWLKSRQYTVDIAIFDSKKNDYVAVSDVLEFHSEDECFHALGVGKARITFNNSLSSFSKYIVETEIGFHDIATEQVLFDSGVDFSNGYLGRGELSGIESLTLNGYTYFDFADLSLLSNLKSIYISGETPLLDVDNLNLSEDTHIYVDSKHYAAYLNSSIWGEYGDSIFIAPEEGEVPVGHCAVVLDANGGKFETEESLATCYPIRGEGVIAISRFVPHLYGNSFIGWQKEDGTSIDETFVFEEDTRLYARYEKHFYKTYFHYNDGTGNYLLVNSRYDEIVQVPLSSQFQREGYSFLGFNFYSDAEDACYAPGSLVNLYEEGVGRIDLYAIWIHKEFDVEIYNGDVLIASSHYKGPYAEVTLYVDPKQKGDGRFDGFSYEKDSPIADFSNGGTIPDFSVAGFREARLRLYCHFAKEYYLINYLDSFGEVAYTQTRFNDASIESPYLSDYHDVQIKTFEEVAMVSGLERMDKSRNHFIGWKDLNTGKIYAYDIDYSLIAGVTYIKDAIIVGGFNHLDSVEFAPVYLPNTYRLDFIQNGKYGSLPLPEYDPITLTCGEGTTYPRKEALGYEVASVSYEKADEETLPLTYGSLSSSEVNLIYDDIFVRSNASSHHEFDGLGEGHIDINYAVKTFAVTFDKNDGSDGEKTLIAYGDKVEKPADPAKKGYTFEGWYDEDDKLYDFDSAVTGDFTLIAHYSINHYSLTLDANGGEVDGKDVMVISDIPFGEEVLIPTPTHTGYTFGGWYLPDGNPASIDGEGRYAYFDYDEDITMLARWNANPYNLTVIHNDGSEEMTVYTFDYDSHYDISGLNLSRPGYTLKGYRLGSEMFPVSGTWTWSSNLTIEALWEANGYLFHFDCAGGDPIEDMEVTFDGEYALPTPNRTGHRFLGWRKVGEEGIEFPGEGTYKYVGDTYLVATWEAKTYAVTLDLDGGSAQEGVALQFECTYGRAYELPGVDLISKTGHKFLYWLYGDKQVALSGTWNIDASEGKATLKAVYSANVYTINLDADGGNCPVESLSAIFGTKTTLPKANKPGWNFLGWRDIDSGELLSPETEFVYEYARDLDLIAEYSIGVYKITYVLNGGTNSASNLISYTYGDTVTLHNPSWLGSEFLGWYDNSSFSGSPVTSIEWDEYGDKTFYAKWDVGDYTNFAGGKGTAERPYLIKTADQLANISKYMSASYRLINDISLSSYSNWNPLGGFYLGTAFNGTLDGNGYSISGLRRTAEIAESNSRSYFGLFGYIGAKGTVKTVSFTGVNINVGGPAVNNNSTRAFFGTVAGKCQGTISSVNVSGSISYSRCTNGETWIGGITGYAYYAKIYGCTNRATIYADRYACGCGGIVGYTHDGSIQSCQNYANVTVICTDWWGFAYGSGIVAASHNTTPTTLVSCYSYATIKASKYDNSNIFGDGELLVSQSGFAKRFDAVY